MLLITLDQKMPRVNPHNSPYSFSENRVIDGVALQGKEVRLVPGEIGFFVGAAIDSGRQMLTNYYDKKPLLENIDYADVLISGAERAAVGAGLPPFVARSLAFAGRISIDLRACTSTLELFNGLKHTLSSITTSVFNCL